MVDASLVVDALLIDGAARKSVGTESLYAPHLLDVELTHVLRRMVSASEISADEALTAIQRAQRLGVTRYPAYGLLERVWELRDNLTAYEATYVAVAEALDCPLVTADARIARAPGVRCP